MGGAENFGRIDGRLRMGFQPFDPRQLLVYLLCCCGFSWTRVTESYDRECD